MNLKNILLFTLFSVSFIVVLTSWNTLEKNTESIEDVIERGRMGGVPTSPTSLKMYELIEKYSEEYEVPKHIAYNVAFLETRYQGPFHWNYVPSKTSPVGAVGPMQIMPSTAKFINKTSVPTNTLRTNIELNIRTSMKLLRHLHDRYGDWGVVCGCYNTGRPIINGYARFCETNINYQKNWIYLKGV
jgi:soluble lytic murein transglycosylase-like protein